LVQGTFILYDIFNSWRWSGRTSFEHLIGRASLIGFTGNEDCLHPPLLICLNSVLGHSQHNMRTIRRRTYSLAVHTEWSEDLLCFTVLTVDHRELSTYVVSRQRVLVAVVSMVVWCVSRVFLATARYSLLQVDGPHLIVSTTQEISSKLQTASSHFEYINFNICIRNLSIIGTS